MPEPESAKPPDNSQPELQPRQRLLFRELQKLDGKHRFSDMYLGALRVFRDRSNPDRLVLAAHGLRELMRKLALQLAAHSLPSGSIHRTDGLPSHLPRLQKAWLKLGWDGKSELGFRKVRPFLHAAGGFFASLGSRPSRSEIGTHALRRLDKHPVPLPPRLEELQLDAWGDIERFFLGVCHHDRLAKDEEFEAYLIALEAFFLDRLRPRTF